TCESDADRLYSIAFFIAFSHSRHFQSLNQKPETRYYFEDTYGRIEPPQINYLGEVRKNDESESAHRSPHRGDHTPGSQCGGDIARLPPQVAEDCRCKSQKQQADIILVKTRAEI